MASKSELESRIDMIDSMLSLLQEVRASEMNELEKIGEKAGQEGQATISFSWKKERSSILLSVDRAGFQNLLELVLSEACKAKKEASENGL
jgi:hypothetical protein